VPGIAPRHPPTPPDVRFSASGGWHLGSSSVVRSQRPRFRILAQVEGLLPWPVARQTGMRNRSVTFRCFIRRFVDSPELNLAPSIPSALRYSRLSPCFIATTASADFPRPLSPGISLGQCRPCPLTPSGSTVTVDDSWASLVLACSPPMTGLAASSCSYGRRFASSPFAPVPCGSSLAVRLRLLSSPRRGPFTPRGSAPARRTRDALPRAP
jgi:hypothetical protein